MKNIALFPIIAILLISSSCRQKTDAVVTEEEAKVLLDNAVRAYTGGDSALIDKVWTTGYVLHDPLLPKEIRGIDSLKKVFAEGADLFKRYKIEFDFENLIVRGDKIVAFYNWSTTLSEPLDLPGVGIIPASGKTISYAGIYVGRVEDGKLAESWFFYNPLDYYQGLGFKLVPPELPASEEK